MKKLFLLLILPLAISLGQSLNPKVPVYITADSLIRPTNYTTYASNDVVNDSLTSSPKILSFKWAGSKYNAGGIIVWSMLEVDTSSTTNSLFRLLLFRDTVPSVADNGAWSSSHAHNAKMIGFIDYSLETNGGTATAISQITNLIIPFQVINPNEYIYGVLLAKGAYVPKANSKFRIKLGIIRDNEL
jgi:hypothetical protein